MALETVRSLEYPLNGGFAALKGGANDAIRTLLELAPPRAVVLRGDDEVEIPTADVIVGDDDASRPRSGCELPPAPCIAA